MWQNSLRNAVFSATLMNFLQSGGLMTLPAVSDQLGSKYQIFFSEMFSQKLQSSLNGRASSRSQWKTTSTALFLS